MKNFLIALVALAATVSCATLHTDLVAEINAKATTWTARKNFDNLTLEQMKAMTGIIGIHPDPDFRLPKVFHEVRDGIPDTFDSRSVWSECESIGTIRNQGACGSCWAFAAVEVMSDRLCIYTAGAKKFTFSPEELVSCCTACGSGCSGGYLLTPFQYWQSTGIPSGGDEGSNFGCRPYTAASTGVTPQCNERCVSGYSTDWSHDVRHGIAAFEVTTTVDQIQHEILINGPVEALLVVFEDFYSYGSGVYQHTSGNNVGNHAVKIIGWGSENGVPYWLIANSWGAGWGNDGGFFKILRGQNHCSIESYVTAGNPNTAE